VGGDRFWGENFGPGPKKIENHRYKQIILTFAEIRENVNF